MEGDEDSVGVLRPLETTHRLESCVEMTDVRFKPVRRLGNAGVEKVREAMLAPFSEALEDVVMDGIHAEDIVLSNPLKVLSAQKERLWRRA